MEFIPLETVTKIASPTESLCTFRHKDLLRLRVQGVAHLHLGAARDRRPLKCRYHKIVRRKLLIQQIQNCDVALLAGVLQSSALLVSSPGVEQRAHTLDVALLAGEHQRGVPVVVRPVDAGLVEQHAHTLDVAVRAGEHQRGHPVLGRPVDRGLGSDQRRHTLDAALHAGEHQRGPPVLARPVDRGVGSDQRRHTLDVALLGCARCAWRVACGCAWAWACAWVCLEIPRRKLLHQQL